MNLWLIDGEAPPEGSHIEVVISGFEFEPAQL